MGGCTIMANLIGVKLNVPFGQSEDGDLEIDNEGWISSPLHPKFLKVEMTDEIRLTLAQKTASGGLISLAIKEGYILSFRTKFGY